MPLYNGSNGVNAFKAGNRARIIGGGIVSDNFDRADGALGIATTGQTWSYLSGSAWVILTNQAKPVVSEMSIPTISAFSNGDASVKLTFSAFEGMVFRAQDVNNFLYSRMNATSINIGRRLTGGFTTLASFSSTFNVGQVYTVRVVFSGSTIQLYLDGSLVATASNETNFLTSTQCGLYTSNSINGRFDDYSVVEL